MVVQYMISYTVIEYDVFTVDGEGDIICPLCPPELFDLIEEKPLDCEENLAQAH